MKLLTIFLALALSHTHATDWYKPDRTRYARDWKFTSNDAMYRKGRIGTEATTTKVIETTMGGRSSSSPDYPKYKFTTIFPSNTTMFTKIVKLGTEDGVEKKFTPLSTTQGSSTTPRLVSKSSTKKPLTTQKSVLVTTNRVTSASVVEVTTEKPHSADVTTRDNSKTHTYYHPQLKEKPKIQLVTNSSSQNLVPLPAGASAALVKPTKYHYYPHNQHIYLLPECAIQQVCNAVYVRLNYTQPLCACPSRYRDPCSASLMSDDLHTTELITDPNGKRALTLVKTCEPTAEMRECRLPRDWSLLALQNIRTGKSHYLVICRCPENSVLEGPISHDQPTYASVPGIRVYGMMCVQMTGPNRNRVSRPLRYRRSLRRLPFSYKKLKSLVKTIIWD